VTENPILGVRSHLLGVQDILLGSEMVSLFAALILRPVTTTTTAQAVNGDPMRG